MRRFGRGLATAVFAATLGWAGGVEAQQRIVIYSSNDATLNKLVATEFTKATGVAADVVSAGSGVVIKRVNAQPINPCRLKMHKGPGAAIGVAIGPGSIAAC